MKVFLLALVAACTDQSVVDVVFDQPGVPADMQSWTEAGLTAWRGHEPGPTTLHVTFAPSSELAGKAGLTNGHSIQLAMELSGPDLATIAAHEAGHALFGKAEHLPAGPAVMTTPPTSDEPTELDFSWAGY